MSENWIDDLTVGDSVIVAGSRYHPDYIAQVERFTKTQIVVKNARSKFRRSDGREIGGDVWSNQVIEIATPERIEKIKMAKRRSRLINFVMDIDWNDVSAEKLEKIVKTVKD